MAGTVWFFNGNIVMDSGHVVVCDSCPCQPCSFTIWLEGTDYRDDLTSTFHSFTVKLNNGSIIDGTFYGSGGPDVDKDFKASGSGRSISITLENDGQTGYDTFSWTVGGQVYLDNINAKNIEYEIKHSFSGAAHTSVIDDYGDSLDCPNNGSEDFE